MVDQRPKRASARLEIAAFRSGREFRTWLVRHRAGSLGVWVRIYKKGSGVPTVTYAEALDQALCFGWIDAQKQLYDEHSWLQRFTPRRPKSGWSKRNTEHAERLIRSGEMTPAGLREVEAAKADGRWRAAYDSPARAAVPEDFLRLLAKNRRAHAFFTGLNRANLYAIAYRLQTAKKPETRETRMRAIIEMLARGEKFH